jgi:hypothetical protein
MRKDFIDFVHEYITTYNPEVSKDLAEAIYNFYEYTTDNEEELKMALRHFLLTVIYPTCKFKLRLDENGGYMKRLKRLINKLATK